MTSFRIAILFLFSIALREKSVAEKPAAIAADGEWETWSQCSCPANDPGYDPTQDRPPSAKMAYLISVHNRRTLQDGAHLLKAIMETSFPGNTAIILIHVDGRVGISSRESAAEKDDEGTNYLYHDSPLRKYVDACLDTPICARNGRSGLRDESGNNAMVLEVHSHFSPEWSKWSMNDPTLWAMDYLTHHKRLKRRPGAGSWDVFVNLSGDTLPVVTAERIAQLFEPQKGPLGSTNFVTSSSCVTGLVPTSIFHFPKGGMKRAHYFQHGIPKKMSYIDSSTGKWENDVETTIYFGSQWMALTHDFVEYVVRSMDHPNGQGNVLKETLIDTAVLMTDETFFATLLMNAAEFNSTIPQLNSDGALKSYPSLHALRYERMDENIPNSWGKYTSSSPLYDVPTKFGKATDGEGAARPWGPYFLGAYDLGAIRDSGALFVRKASWTIDPNLIKLLPVKMRSDDIKDGKLEWDQLPDLRWPELGVNIKDPFVWAAKNDDDA